MGMKKIGDWSKIKNLVKSIGRDIKSERDKALTAWADKAAGIAVGHIEAQDLNWKPLAQATLEAKQAKGQPTDTLYATGQYRDSIAAIRKDDMAFAGIKHGERTKETGESLTMIAAVHEFGALSVGIEARPLWQPTMKEVMAWNAKENSVAVNVIKKWTKKYGRGPVK